MVGAFQGFEFDALAGHDAKEEALSKLSYLAEHVDDALAMRKSMGLVHRAVKSWGKGRVARTAQLAFDAVNACEDNPHAYLVLGIALEKMGYLYKALVTYEKAYKLKPEDPEIIISLAQLARKFKMNEVSEKLCEEYLSRRPDGVVGYNTLACIYSETGRVEKAIDLLKDSIFRYPESDILWNVLATILAEEGRVEESLVFYQEAIRLSPQTTRYYHNLGYAYMHLERIEDAIKLYEDALEHVQDPVERLESRYSRAICMAQAGYLKEGFAEYEVRNDKRFRGFAQYMVDAPRWAGEPLEGKEILVVGEQGIGDEMMFASALPDIQKMVGPEGKMAIAVEPRLVPLFGRSFPDAMVGRYEDRALKNEDGRRELRFFPMYMDKAKQPDYYAEFGSLLQYVRDDISKFPHQPYLVPDPERVEGFRRLLNKQPGEVLVGICWRSMMLSMKRGKYYSELDMWGPVLKTPGARFINLQYGDCEKELAEAEKLFGITIERVPDLNLTNDIDGNAALSAALDLVISAPTAVAATAGAVGTETWFLLSNGGWPELGTEEYPWYRKTRVFASRKFGAWQESLARIAAALQDVVKEASSD